MDASAIHQYRFLLALLAAGLLLSLIVGTALSRGTAVSPAPEPPSPDAGAQRHLLPHIMLLLVALAVAAGVMLLVPAAMIFRFLDSRPVLIGVLLVLAILGAPLLYAWRARPFS